MATQTPKPRSALAARTEEELREWYAAAERGDLFPPMTPEEEAEAWADVEALLDDIEKRGKS